MKIDNEAKNVLREAVHRFHGIDESGDITVRASRLADRIEAFIERGTDFTHAPADAWLYGADASAEREARLSRIEEAYPEAAAEARKAGHRAQVVCTHPEDSLRFAVEEIDGVDVEREWCDACSKEL